MLGFLQIFRELFQFHHKIPRVIGFVPDCDTPKDHTKVVCHASISWALCAVYRGIMQRIAVICGWVEALSVLIGGAAFLFAHTSGTQNVDDKAHVALGIVCLVFAAGIALATYGLQKSSDLAQTPFVLIQVFVGIGAYLGIGSTSAEPRILGSVAMVMAIVAAITAVLANRGGPKSA